jgi:hypothetical protein
VERIKGREDQRSRGEAISLLHAEILKEEAPRFFVRLRNEAQRGIRAVAQSLAIEQDIFIYPFERPDLFRATNTSRRPFIVLELRLLRRKITVSKTTRNEVDGHPQLDRDWSIDLCLDADERLYLCSEGRKLLDMDEALSLIVGPLFHIS